MIALLLLLADPARVPVPADVATFVEDYETCEHWLGEQGSGWAERERQVAIAIRATCRGIDRRRARLLAKYRAPSAARRRLLELEPIES